MEMTNEERVDDLRAPWFNKILDKYLTLGTMYAEDYESLTPRQKDVIQTIKRALARINK